MPEFEKTIEIAATPDRIFAYVAELARHHEWQLDLRRARLRPPGPTRAGSEGYEVRRISRIRVSSALRVEAFDPPHLITIGTSNRRLAQRRAISIEPLGNGSSRVRMAVQIRGRGLARLVAPAVSRGVTRNADGHLLMLKLILERHGAGTDT